MRLIALLSILLSSNIYAQQTDAKKSDNKVVTSIKNQSELMAKQIELIRKMNQIIKKDITKSL